MEARENGLGYIRSEEEICKLFIQTLLPCFSLNIQGVWRLETWEGEFVTALSMHTHGHTAGLNSRLCAVA